MHAIPSQEDLEVLLESLPVLEGGGSPGQGADGRQQLAKEVWRRSGHASQLTPDRLPDEA
jgi:hypothetical protein